MDYHKEECASLLSPSVSDDDLLFSSPASLSGEVYSLSSATLAEARPTARRIRLGGTPAVIAGLLFGAALTAVVHHVYLSILRGRIVSSQFWIKNSSNVLSALVQWLCTGSLLVSLTQLIRQLIHRQLFNILQVNHLFGLSNPFQILRLTSSRRVRNSIPAIVIATLLQAFTFVSVLAPNSLEVGLASPQNTIISVPTVCFDKANLSEARCDPYPSAAWQKVLGQALQSDTLLGWNAPPGCGSACNYMIQYAAPALRCIELDTDEVVTMVPSDDDLTTVYNATYNTDRTTYSVANISMAWRTAYNTNRESTIAGARCSLYNTTQQAVVKFANNMGNISPSIISYDSLVEYESVSRHNCGTLQDGNYPQDLEYWSTYALIQNWIYDQLDGIIVRSTTGSSITVTNLLASSNLFSMNETAGTFTGNSENVVNALEQIFVNATVALIAPLGQTTIVNASVVHDQLVRVYHGHRLWMVYATTLTVTAACGAIALACILKNGQDSDLTILDIVRASGNSQLDAVVDGEKRGNMGVDTMLQDVLQGRDIEGNTSGVSVLARPRRKGLN